MKILRTVAELRAWRKSLPSQETLGFVPTMGALHSGHLSLVEQSKKGCTRTIVSIFVNPTQFGPNEDLSRYPRPFEADCALLEKAGTDAVFSPSPEEMYLKDASTFVVEEKVSLPLCGEFRPGHFRGVATIVLKLFNLVQPDTAFFGQKDAQQCAVIERMVRDLSVPVQIVRGATVREPDGLALSSRNIYLSNEEREIATDLFRGFRAAQALFDQGHRQAAHLKQAALQEVNRSGRFQVQYWDVRHPETLELIEDIGSAGALLAVAAYLGKTRLIDNWVLTPKA
jgi:pantoate--beta-alanine ligase